MAVLASGIKDFAKASSFAKDGLRATDSWRFSRILVMAYYSLGKYNEAIESFRHAYARNPDVFSQPDLMFSAAQSYAFMGEHELAKATLAALAKARPDVEASSKYESVVKYIFLIHNKNEDAH